MSVNKKWSKNRAPHRTLYSGSRGLDVAQLQHALNKRAKVRKVRLVKADGNFGPATRKLWISMSQAIGLNHRKCTIGNQILMRSPWKRSAGMKRKERLWTKRRRRPLRLRALKVADTLVGVMEHGGNNVGPMVTKIIRENGGTGPEPWCGDFVAYCYRHAGSKAVQRGWAAAWSLGRLAGMHPVSRPLPGDIVVYSFGQGHCGIFVKRTGPGSIEAIEGNTGASGAVSDSSTGGDGVYRKRRSTSQVLRYARVTR